MGTDPSSVGLRCGLALAACFLTGCAAPTGERPRAEYDPASGRLIRFHYDANRNGRHDATSIMDGTRVRWIELDLDENGKVDRWDYYSSDRVLEKVGLSRENDGVLDAYAYQRAGGALDRIELSTRRDGWFDRVEFYDRGLLVRSQDDLDRDGRVDKWDTYRSEPNAPPGEPKYGITSTAFDDLGRGTPSRRFVYGHRGVVLRVEVDPDGDGRFIANPAGEEHTP